jgi:hypothetical protein
MASIPTGPAADRRADSRRLADFAAKAAETFVSAYYAASDSPQRTNLVPTLYLPNSSIVWNGTPVSGQQELQAMLNSMPGSKHEVHTFDCHALGGAVDGGKSCSLLRPKHTRLFLRDGTAIAGQAPAQVHPLVRCPLWLVCIETLRVLSRTSGGKIKHSPAHTLRSWSQLACAGTLFIRVRYLCTRSTVVSSSI